MGINLDAIAEQLQAKGVDSFADSAKQVMLYRFSWLPSFGEMFIYKG
jgi:hypothetical protein